MNGNYWYAAEQEDNLKPKAVLEAIFWGDSICLWVTSTGQTFACANACAGGVPLTKVCFSP